MNLPKLGSSGVLGVPPLYTNHYVPLFPLDRNILVPVGACIVAEGASVA
jgi:hypothetical protein